ncbi:hypothetical protein BC941DRAFT_422133 [Chlamydoabsidia padenii]|nr:hypothetical protein BC941DRAFT_422133 [Chlamydoabsidia padenii]
MTALLLEKHQRKSIMDPDQSTCYNHHLQYQYQRSQHHQPTYTWLVFKDEQWKPFDRENQIKLEQTLSVDGTFVDICDSLFTGVKRVRVFPRNNYLSYLGLKYRLSRVLQPDAWGCIS